MKAVGLTNNQNLSTLDDSGTRSCKDNREEFHDKHYHFGGKVNA